MLFTHNQKILPSVSTDEFLPPVSRWTSLAGLFLIINCCGAIALASYIKYNVTVKTPATVRPAGDIRIVQPEREGTVKGIYIRENQIVKKGDIIARLDDTEIDIKNSQLQSSIQDSKLQLDQIEAQIIALDNQINADRKLTERTIISAEADLVRNQRDYQDQQVKTQNDLAVAQANLQKAEAGLQKARADLDFAIQDRDRYQELAQLGAIGKREYEQRKLAVRQAELQAEAEQKAIDIARANVETARAALNPSTATLAIAKERIAQEDAKGESSIAAFVREKNALIQRKIEMRNQIRQYQKEIQRNIFHRQTSVIRATSDGVILKLNLRNIGQVVRASEPIAEIVPDYAPLVIKAMVPVSEIKKVEIGQKVQLRIDACPYPDYGTLKGSVSNISPDAIAPSTQNTATMTSAASSGGASYFEASIQPEKLSFGDYNKTCNLQVGMNATADIISKEETVLQFILRKARLMTDL
ncbi:HlyD family efflux transporter periplasmic adaptor subunit [Chlorogloeopsis sp. ULAP01]|uniref:HlyD family secretion protein n=1 Tax=Chlorogloeopsis sp. ULAP01 TaxID=3056483 RepID=UPI0025AA6588|nr:HlyD family efflux transporter periplasmic adaptor subunit [Chlorogloeopsis sp. ULAP01]MDM9382738.1 HlyD family efflux transporter periplasmic adaptor subunit [Chlorogloeopsis sp. ULAP01]